MTSVGSVLELEVGPAAAGGGCVARWQGQVVFLRHALPGERVRASVTEVRDRFLRAETVEVLSASPDRVEPPCPYARPLRCGGCDWQHASAQAQRRIKAEVVAEQFRRIAGLSVPDLVVEPLPGGLLGWRTRITYAVDAEGRPGLHRHRSHDIEHVDRCLLGVPGVGDTAALARRWPGRTGIEAARGDDRAVTLLAHSPGSGRRGRGRRPPDRVTVVDGPALLSRHVLGRGMQVSADGFWQVHPAAADTFAQALLDELRPQAGERVVDLYAGAGALTAVLADAVGAGGCVLGVEAAPRAVSDAAVNLGEQPWARVERGRIDAALVSGLGQRGELAPRPDLVVLDPPRAGAGPQVMAAIFALRPRAVGYVSCDPATLARDVACAAEAGWDVTRLRVFDAFPMTAHVECLVTLSPDTAGDGP